MEGGVISGAPLYIRDDFKSVDRETVLQNPYVLRLAFSAGIGGLLFGYDTGVISGAPLYIRDDFKSVDRETVLQKSIVTVAVAGAIIGAAIGGWLNDKYGWRTVILIADFLFFIGAILMALTPNLALLIIGRVFFSLALGSGTWDMALDGWSRRTTAILQFVLMLLLPESPRWLYRKGREEETKTILRKIYPSEEVGIEIQALKESVEKEALEKESSENISFIKLIQTTTVRRGLIAGVGLQIFQQFVGINTMMYYSPTIVQLAGFASNQTALLLLLLTAKRFWLDSNSSGTASVQEAEYEISREIESESAAETSHFTPYTCPDYRSSGSSTTWNCMKCLKASSPSCGFCSSSENKAQNSAVSRGLSDFKQHS
ncbi:unnamed protein product [Fraxinus pennsylvanica]|uniref:Major facilitator superfamily (MFS) profile domain-containing protein n=1 Tax=Fraxinus pennsylvanica TaxID=56036 RepID=A0AAD1Z534_9LAMI|nr:unnamed protein product [Fraxinus pennsylvanica]